MKNALIAIGVALLFMLLAAASSLARLSSLSLLWTAMAVVSFVMVLLLGFPRKKEG